MTITADSIEPDDKEQHHLSTYLPAKEVHVVTGRSGAGKTHLAFQFLDRFRQHLEPILYIAGDRSKLLTCTFAANVSGNWRSGWFGMGTTFLQ